jgi:hypothetical protein
MTTPALGLTMTSTARGIGGDMAETIVIQRVSPVPA